MPNAPLPLGLFVIILATFAPCDIQAQSPLDAPSEKKITVGSEIARAKHVIISALSRQSEAIGLAKFLINMGSAVDENRAAQKDSDGFLLGARFMQWEILDSSLRETGGLRKYSSPADIADCQRAALKYFIELRQLQQKLSVSDSALFQALEITDSAKLASIEERLKAYEALR